MGDPNPQIQQISILNKATIHCGYQLIPYIAKTLASKLNSSNYVIITDSTIAGLYLDRFTEEFNRIFSKPTDKKSSSSRLLTYTVRPGEQSKSRKCKEEIEDFLLENRCTRDSVLLALGGGVIGDLVGFVAATFMRGVRFVQVPTTLLAMVDSSIGGKTAIDTPHGKNLIGAFWQPEYIFIDPSFLKTLPMREFSNGMAEVIKTAAIWDEEEFSVLEANSEEIISVLKSPSSPSSPFEQNRGQDFLLRIITASISVKSHIVTNDERETTGLRNLVNFGHSVGHAIEAILTPTVLHGECVAIGMILEAEIARNLGVLNQVALGRLDRCLKSYNLPTSMDRDPLITGHGDYAKLTPEKLLDIMKIDKKNSGNEKKIVLLSKIGATFEMKATVVKDAVIKKVLSKAVLVVPGEAEMDANNSSGLPLSTPQIGCKAVIMSTPGSKSISNRALILASLADGTCRLKNLLHSDDTQVMMNALIDLRGAQFKYGDAGEILCVKGGKGMLYPPSPAGKQLYLGNAGTAARFLTTVCMLVRPSISGGKRETPTTTLTGNARMKQRPIGPLVDALVSNGAHIEYLESPGSLPIAISPGNYDDEDADPSGALQGGASGFKGGHIRLSANISSQYVSSILLCAPYAREPVVLELVGEKVISQPYIDMTITMMKTFGIEITRRRISGTSSLSNTYDIPLGTYTNPPEYTIESDASSATYPLAIAAITGTTCTITGIGSDSLQGDAGFARGVLEKMGCTVEQTETSTTVTGPKVGALRVACGTALDMEMMTDAFLTASVLAAVATQPPISNGPTDSRLESSSISTKIVGIANQREKECNRIRAMMDELAKFGVKTNELDDGLEIYGIPYEEMKLAAGDIRRIHCYDDHRVAMAFSVLGTLIPGTVLEEKRCVEKTWPGWWDDLGNKIGIEVQGVSLDDVYQKEIALEKEMPTNIHSTKYIVTGTDSTVLLIGMRGAGKSFIGKMAASELGWAYIDADEYLISPKKHNLPSCKQFVEKHGWPAFRAAELAVLNELLEECHSRTVISLGGGIVETGGARDVLRAYVARGGKVVHIKRDIGEIAKYLNEENARPAYPDGETIEDVFNRRIVWFEQCSSHTFVNFIKHPFSRERHYTKIPQSSRLCDDVRRFFGHITGQSSNLVDLDKNRTYFLSLTLPSIEGNQRLLDEELGHGIFYGIHAIELRVDLLSPTILDETGQRKSRTPNVPPKEYIEGQFAILKQLTSLPVVYTVRTISQGGTFPDKEHDRLFELLELGIKMGAEYVDVEITLPTSRIWKLIKMKGFSKIIASYHDWTGSFAWDGPEIREKYNIAAALGDVVKLVGKANSLQDNLDLRAFATRLSSFTSAISSITLGMTGASGSKNKPLIAINMGTEGQMSRILNRVFTPVTHPLLPIPAAPGQLSVMQIQTGLHLLGQLPRKRFYLLGTPIQKSPSPILHNVGFETLGLPHEYALHETDTVDQTIREIITREDFGGASVTIPHKISIQSILGELSDAAKMIGAVNTIIPVPGTNGIAGTILRGDNTDWIGIRNTILAQSHERWTAKDTGLVIGAGGTARAAIYALKQLGLGKIFILNRTVSTAEDLVREFGESYNLNVLKDFGLLSDSPPAIIIGAIPASATSADISEELFQRKGGGVVVDLAYRPMKTPLLELAERVSENARANVSDMQLADSCVWKSIPGIEVLLHQGYQQFELWTGFRAPKRVIRESVLKFYAES